MTACRRTTCVVEVLSWLDDRYCGPACREQDTTPQLSLRDAVALKSVSGFDQLAGHHADLAKDSTPFEVTLDESSYLRPLPDAVEGETQVHECPGLDEVRYPGTRPQGWLARWRERMRR